MRVETEAKGVSSTRLPGCSRIIQPLETHTTTQDFSE